MSATSIRISCDQKWYHLGTILSAPFSLPMIVVGHQLAKLYGPGTAICSILVGNLILWIIGLAVISMAIENRSNAIGNVRSYLGKFGAIFMWLVIMISILNWFVHQLNSVVPSIGLFFNKHNELSLLKIGMTMGLITTFLSIGGIQFLKRATLFSSPFIFLYYLYSILQSNFSLNSETVLSLSIPAIISTILVLLPGIINLPTLFRHSRSKPDSYLGLSTMIALISFYEISTIWMQFTDNSEIVFSTKSLLFSVGTLVFISLTLVYINLINIYYASACWETYVPRFEGAKGYVIFGLLGTLSYFFMPNYTQIQLISNITNSCLASLGIVLLIAYLMRIIIKHRPRRFEQALNLMCWLVGCAASAVAIMQDIEASVKPLLLGVAVSAFTFLLVVFIEENIWATKTVLYEGD